MPLHCSWHYKHACPMASLTLLLYPESQGVLLLLLLLLAF